MSISSVSELEGIKAVSRAVALTLRQMREFAAVGMSTKELDEFGGKLLRGFGARSAPHETYGFPGWTCISVNDELAHGIPSTTKILKGGDLINIDVSAELHGFWADNGGSFVLGQDIHGHQPLVDASKKALGKALSALKGGVKISSIGHAIETEARKSGFRVIRNLAGHGVGRSLHEAPEHILCFKERHNKQRFQKNSVVAIETFVSTQSNMAVELDDGWTLVGNRGGYGCQHEHTVLVTDGKPVILTAENGIRV